MSDPIFADPRLAGIYDDLEDDRRDLDHYDAIVDELGARQVLDVGCGTGALACRLARRGLTVTGVDPAAASLAVARGKPTADRVTWLHGDATTLPELSVDVATMTGNVAQVFVTDDSWRATLAGIHAALRRGGHFVFETRNPTFRGWEEWTPERSIDRRQTSAGSVESWVELLTVEVPLVSFRWTFKFLDTGEELVSDSTLRFRDRDEVIESLRAAGYATESIRDAPDRPGRELVFIARAEGGRSDVAAANS